MSAGSEGQYVTFGLGAEVFAVPVALVQEILNHQEPFKIPNGPAYLLGLIDVRGRGVPTLDLRVRLGMPPVEPTLSTRILVLDIALADRVLRLGLVADRVFEVTPFSEDQVEAAPDIGVKWRSEYISGVVRRTEGFVLLIDLPRLMASADAATLAAYSDVEHAA